MRKVYGVTCLLVCISCSTADQWAWPEKLTDIRSKVHFVDREPSQSITNDHQQGYFHHAPVQIEDAIRDNHRPVHTNHDNSKLGQLLDPMVHPMKQCKCVSSSECIPKSDYPAIHNSCGAGQILCCYSTLRTTGRSIQSHDLFTDEMRLFTIQDIKEENRPRSTYNQNSDILFGPKGPVGMSSEGELLVGVVGPLSSPRPNEIRRNSLYISKKMKDNLRSAVNKPLLPALTRSQPSLLSQHLHEHAQPKALTGENPADINPQEAESAQRMVLVGPGGPTGIIGPAYNSQRGVLTGPGGPTGIIGPVGRAQPGRPILTGPGGPTGLIGPANYFHRGQVTQVGHGSHFPVRNRPVLVGPGGPTGNVGPRGYFPFNY